MAAKGNVAKDVAKHPIMFRTASPAKMSTWAEVEKACWRAVTVICHYIFTGVVTCLQQ